MFVADKYINSSGLQTIKNWVEDKIPTSTSDLTNDSGFTTETYVNTAVSNKQDVLTFDNTPTENSNNPVKSGGVYDALQNAGTKIYVSATEPANWNAGDWWYEEVE